jgi:integrase
MGSALMSARGTRQNQRVLPKLITQFLDMERRHAANCSFSLRARPSSIETYKILYIGTRLGGCSAQLDFENGAHSLRATAATNALDHQADIAKVQEWLGHTNISTMRIYDHRKTRPEDSPTFKVTY